MARLSVQLFSGFQVRLDDSWVTEEFESDRVRALLAFLAVETGYPHRREVLAALLWPEATDVTARTNLRHVLANLRHVVADHDAEPPYLLITRQTIQLNLDSDLWIDVVEFEQLLANSRSQETAVSHLRQAVTLANGRFLHGFSLKDSVPFEDWQQQTAEALERQLRGALDQLAGECAASGDLESAIGYARRLVELDPYGEAANRHLLALLAADGQRSAALFHYDEFCSLLADELGVVPAPETEQLVEEIRAGSLTLPLAGGEVGAEPGERTSDVGNIHLSAAREPDSEVRFLMLVAAERARAEEHAEARRRLQQRAALLVVALVLVAALALFSGWQWRRASQEQAAAENNARVALSRELAAAAVANLQTDPELSTLLALHALDASETLEAVNALHQALPALQLDAALPGHAYSIADLDLSADGTYIAAASFDNTTRVWDANGSEVLSVPGASVAISPDGTRLATAGYDAALNVWDLPSGVRLLRLPGHEAERYSVAFGPNGRRLATAVPDGTVIVWNLDTLQQDLVLEGHVPLISVDMPGRGVLEVTFSPDGTRIATAGSDGTARIWDAATGVEIMRLTGHENQVSGVAFSPDGGMLATTGWDGSVRLWDLGDETAVARRVLQVERPLSRVAFSHDGRLVAAVGWDSVPHVWEAVTGREVLLLYGASGIVWDVAFSPDRAHLITAGDDRMVRVWHLSPGREVMTLTTGSVVEGVDFSPDGTLLATAGHDQNVQLWSMMSGGRRLRLHDPTALLLDVAFSPDGALLAAGGTDGTASIWDAAGGDLRHTLFGHESPVRTVAFSPDGSRLATGGIDGRLILWNVATGARLWSAVAHGDLLWGISFHPDGDIIATGGWDGSVSLWDAQTGRRLATWDGMEHGGDVFDVAFSPDGALLAAGQREGVVTLLAVEKDGGAGGVGEIRPLLTISDRGGGVWALAFSPDGRLLASAGLDGVTRIWDVAKTIAAGAGQEHATLHGHTDAVSDLAFSPDGKHLATGSHDSTTRIHAVYLDELVSLARLRVRRGLTEDECRRFLHTDGCPRS